MLKVKILDIGVTMWAGPYRTKVDLTIAGKKVT